MPRRGNGGEEGLYSENVKVGEIEDSNMKGSIFATQENETCRRDNAMESGGTGRNYLIYCRVQKARMRDNYAGLKRVNEFE